MRAMIGVALGAMLAGLAAGQGADAAPAKRLFGAAEAGSAGPPAAHGRHAGGCIGGAEALPESGPGFQTLRLSRNRHWGHPATLAFIRRLGRAAPGLGWPEGFLVGDIAQPRGGPMTYGHASHQSGLDVDIWLRRPERAFSAAEREGLHSRVMVAADRRGVSAAWTAAHGRLIEAAARDAAVARIFVNAAIKAELCRAAPAADRGWLRKVRPWWGHDSHFHVRLACPASSPGCVDQTPPPPGDGCGDALAWWFSDEALNPPPPETPRAPKPEITLADLPAACAALVGR